MSTAGGSSARELAKESIQVGHFARAPHFGDVYARAGILLSGGSTRTWSNVIACDGGSSRDSTPVLYGMR
jgi:hypothetical protein